VVLGLTLLRSWSAKRCKLSWICLEMFAMVLLLGEMIRIAESGIS
jgi:hypothetical protein